MTSLSTFINPLLVATALLGVAACKHTDAGAPGSRELTMRNSVQMVRLPYTIGQEEDQTDDLSDKTKQGLNQFLASIQAGYGDTLILDGPAASTTRVERIATFIRERGLVFAGMAPMGPEPKDGSIVLYVERYRAITPDCGGWEEETDNNRRNNDSAHFGCATATNLGLMVADPRDLIAGHGSGNSTAAAVGAVYTPPQKGTAAPSMTLSFKGMSGVSQSPAGSGQ